MKKNVIVLHILLSFALIYLSCNADKSNGIIGVEVPIGNGRISEETPYLISGVYENTPAYNAGIKPGDIIIQINDMPLTNGMKFDEIFSKYLSGKPGTNVTLYVKRSGENMIFSIVRGERGN